MLRNRHVGDPPRGARVQEPFVIAVPSPQDFALEIDALLSDGFGEWRLVHVAMFQAKAASRT